MITPQKALAKAAKNAIQIQELIEVEIDKQLMNNMTLMGCKVVLVREIGSRENIEAVLKKYKDHGWEVMGANYDYTFRMAAPKP